jgi:hypothetical protein
MRIALSKSSGRNDRKGEFHATRVAIARDRGTTLADPNGLREYEIGECIAPPAVRG